MANRFRKVYFITENNKVFPEQYEMANCYNREEYAKNICEQQQRIFKDETHKMYHNGRPVPALAMHGFYLVHESLFDEILRDHIKG
jgi:hypothetical protein